MTDARIVRTRASLRAAILDLASQKPVTEITVSELAAAADINRVTFYKHYATPAEALREALCAELDVSREAVLNQRDDQSHDRLDDMAAGLDIVLQHIQRHRRLYELSVATPDDGAVAWVLSEHFSHTIKLHLDRRKTDPDGQVSFDTAITSRFLGYGLVGALYTWVRSGDLDTTNLIAALTASIPVWWFPQQD